MRKLATLLGAVAAVALFAFATALYVASTPAYAMHNGLHLIACDLTDTVGGGALGNSPGPDGAPISAHLGWDVGSGQCKSSFTVTRDTLFPSDSGGGIELGLRAEQRRVGQVANNIGDYEVQTGHDTTVPAAADRAW